MDSNERADGSFAITPYQIRASVAEGNPVLRKMSLTSGPDTRPSMSPSVLLNTSSYFALSAGDTTHCEVKETKHFISISSIAFTQRSTTTKSLPSHYFLYSCSFERHTELANLRSF